MKRYFYTDQIFAELMAKYHGMQFDFDCGDARSQKIYRYYIHPDSEKLLVPQRGDIVSMDGDFPYVCLTTAEYAKFGVLYGKRHKLIELECICNFEDKEEFEWWISEGKIIQRNGLAFIWPESEES